MCWTYFKNFGLSQKTFLPSCVPSWLRIWRGLPTYIQICASLSHRKKKKAEPIGWFPKILTATLELFLEKFFSFFQRFLERRKFVLKRENIRNSKKFFEKRIWTTWVQCNSNLLEILQNKINFAETTVAYCKKLKSNKLNKQITYNSVSLNT